MRITEKELGQKLRAEFEDRGGTFEEVAHRAAELLGVVLSSEKPEPGLYRYDGETILIDPQHDWYIFVPSEGTFIFMYDGDHEKLTPARVISEQDWTDLNTKADEQTRDIQDLSEVLDLWKAKGVYAEARESELRAELAGANETLCEMMPAEPGSMIRNVHTSWGAEPFASGTLLESGMWYLVSTEGLAGTVPTENITTFEVV